MTERASPLAVLGLIEVAAGNLDEAVPLLDGALVAARDRDWHALVAEFIVDLARALARRDRRGDADRARELADEAVAAAERLGMPLLARDASALLGDLASSG